MSAVAEITRSPPRRTLSRESVPGYAWRKRVDLLVKIVCVASTLVAIVPLVAILGFILVKGGSALTAQIFTETMKAPGAPDQGLANAIVGTLEILFFSCLFGVPLGVLSGMYLAEFGDSRFGRIIRYAADVMSGIPSVIAGILVYTIIVVPTGGFSAIAGGVALAILMIPTVMRTSEELLRLVPGQLREGALALGVPKWRASLKVVLRTAAPGIATGVVLAIARVCGETAPLIFSAGSATPQFYPGVTEPTPSLTVAIYQYATGSDDAQRQVAWAGAFILVSLVLVLNLAARFLVRHRVKGART